MFETDTHPDQPRRYTAKHRETPQQLQGPRKLLRRLAVQRRTYQPLLSDQQRLLNHPRRELAAFLDSSQIGV